MEMRWFVCSLPSRFVHPRPSSMRCRQTRTLSGTAEVQAANETSLLIRQQQLSSPVALKAPRPKKKRKKKKSQGSTTPVYLVAQKPGEKERAPANTGMLASRAAGAV